MDPITITAASGMRSRTEALDLLSNNLANASTPGYKAGRESYSVYLSESAAAGDPPMGRSPVVERQWIDLTQGVLTATGNPDDLALSGDGFFVVDGPQGPLLTRGGTFRVGADNKIVTLEGFEFMTESPRRIRAQAGLRVAVDPDGTVRQDGQPLGKLKTVAAHAATSELVRSEGTYFRTDLSRLNSMPASRAEVRQGYVEGSNLIPSEAAVRLVGILRQFESLQRAIQPGGEMNRRAAEEVARVQP